ncbi:MAG: hypothetical protein J5787_04760 [Alphaproteobacteria bacterium]|nr:hypothetical protein [Alphaproteobacteria bacterium]MBO4644330.1 hypothetical protein [Alphaproteobacteria bacterium]
MENLELRIQKLEKKYNTLKYSVLFLMCFAAYAGMSGTTKLSVSAHAQQRSEASKEKAAAGVPLVVEAEVFLLKDAAGKIRGVWSADDTTTSFAMMHKDKYPIIAMAVDRKNASMSLTDVYSGKISIGLNDSIRSVAIMDDTKKNNIYLGLTGAGEAAFDMISTGNSAFVIDGSTASIDMSGDTSILALTETVGGTVALKAQPSSSALTFLDHQNKQTASFSTIDGKTQIYMNSPSTKEEKTIGTMPDNLLSFVDMQSEEDEEKKETDNKAAKADKEKVKSEKEENKIVNMKTYSPFSK